MLFLTTDASICHTETKYNHKERKKMAKTKRIIARVTDSQWAKLDKQLKAKGQTVTQWIQERIDLMRVK